MLNQQTTPLALPSAQSKATPATFTWLPLWIALAVLLVFHLRYVPVELAHYTDPVIYLSGAQSIAEGQGYRFITHAGAPHIGCHPPLNSAYLALFWKLNPRFPENVGLLYGAMFLVVAVTFVLFYRYCLKNGMPPIVAGALILAWGLSSNWGTLLWGFMSDIMLGALVLGLANYWWGANDALSERRWLITGIFLSLMYLTRTASLPFMAVLALVVGVLSWKHHTARPMLAFLLPIVPTILLWKWWATGTPSYSDYIKFRIAQEGSWLGVLKYNFSLAIDYLFGLGFMTSIFGSVINLPSIPSISNTPFSGILTIVAMILCWTFTALWLFGLRQARTKQEWIIGSIVGCYLLQLCLYPCGLIERALYVVLPFVLVWAWKGLGEALQRWPRLRLPLLRPALLLAIGFCILGNSFGFTRAANYLKQCSRREELEEVGTWLRTNSPPQTVVAATLTEPTMHFYNYSGRRVVENYLQAVPPFSVVSHSTNGAAQASYVLLDWYSYLKPEELRGGLKLAKSSSHGYYRLYSVTEP